MQFTTPQLGASTHAHIKAPRHVRIPHAWMEQWLPIIGGSAFAVYAVLLKRRGKNATAWPSHADIANQSGVSVSTVKRALKTLEKHGLCGWSQRHEETRRGKERQTSNEYFLTQIERPSPTQNDPAPRSKKSDKTSNKAKLVKTETNSVTASVVVDSKESVPDPETATTPAERALIACGMKAAPAAKLADDFPEPLILQQCEWWPARKGAGLGALVNSIRQNWDAPGRQRTPETPQNGAAYSDYRPSDVTPETAVLERRARVIELCLANLDASRLAYIEQCCEIEKLPIEQVLERDCNWEWDRARRQAAKEKAH